MDMRRGEASRVPGWGSTGAEMNREQAGSRSALLPLSASNLQTVAYNVNKFKAHTMNFRVHNSRNTRKLRS